MRFEAATSRKPATRPHLAAWLALNRGAVEVDIRVRDPDKVPEDVREALRVLKPLALALLVTDVINADGDGWSSYRAEVDALEASGLSRAEALRRAYQRRFKVDPGDVDPGGLTWLWSGV